jgi:hypothetical protein
MWLRTHLADGLRYTIDRLFPLGKDPMGPKDFEMPIIERPKFQRPRL